MHAQVLQSCSLSDPTDCSLPGSSVHGILQVRILEWVPCPPPGDLPNLHLLCLLQWQVGSLPVVPPGISCVLMSGSQKKEKEKNEEGAKSTGLLNPLEVISACGSGVSSNEGKCNKISHLLLHLPFCDQKQQPAITAQILDIWKTETFLPTLAPSSCVQAAPGTVHSCLPWG